jgi:hypothetical protein
MAEIELGRRVKMTIILQKGQGNGGLKKVKLEEKRDEEREVIIRHQTTPMKWKAWSWQVLHENAARLL